MIEDDLSVGRELRRRNVKLRGM